MADARTKQTQQWDARIAGLNAGAAWGTQMTPEQQWAQFTGLSNKLSAGTDAAVAAGATLQAQMSGLYPTTTDTGGGGDGGDGGASAEAALLAAEKARNDKDARAELEDWLLTFFDPTRDKDVIAQMMSFVDQSIVSDDPPSKIMLDLKKQPFFTERFKGNAGLRAMGLPELSFSEYLQYEKAVAEQLQSAGLGDIATRGNFAAMIGGAVSLAEAQDRIVNVYSRIKNADQQLKDEMQRLGELGNLSSADFAAALLTGKEGAESLKRKIATAEVSTEFTTRGLTSALGAGELAKLGVSREQAMQGAEYARAGTKRLGDLASIYGADRGGIQGELESEAFKGLASERRKKLTEQESASFAGSSGTGTPSLGKNRLGQF